jgi:sugar phosphate isomerase/epimerase
MPSGHTVMTSKHWDEGKKEFTDAWKYTVEDAAICGQKYVISPWLQEDKRKTMDDMKGMMNIFNKSGELCNKSGMKFGYHNHDFEFSESLNGRTLFDIILGETDPKLVMQQLDIGNMINGGAKALDIMKKYPGRFISAHLADYGQDKKQQVPVGKGIVDWKEFFAALPTGGAKNIFVEMNEPNFKDSVDYLKTI